jgi:transcriptional regulator with XRE-family HTH domain
MNENLEHDEETERIIKGQIIQFIERLKEERERAHISQMDLSFKAGLSQNLINTIETGRRIPNLSTILRICNALDIHPGILFSISDNERQKAQDILISTIKKYI